MPFFTTSVAVSCCWAYIRSCIPRVFLLYVILLTGQCLLVLRRLSLLEDGLVMAGMALFLFLDPTFFNNVFYTYKLNVGLEVNSLCLILSMSLYAILKSVGNIPWTRRS